MRIHCDVSWLIPGHWIQVGVEYKVERGKAGEMLQMNNLRHYRFIHTSIEETERILYSNLAQKVHAILTVDYVAIEETRRMAPLC